MEKILYTEIGPTGEEYKKGDWKEFVIHTEKEIKGFFGPYRFLSNFWPATVMLDGITYISTELAYQAAKWKPEDREYFQTCNELESIDFNRNNKPNLYTEEEWSKRKVEVMRDLLKQKFDPIMNPENYKKLIETGETCLEEMNWWQDLFWGTDKNGNGDNMLGKLLMEIRVELTSKRVE